MSAASRSSNPHRRPEINVDWPQLPQRATLVHFAMVLSAGLVAVLWKLADAIDRQGWVALIPMALVLAVLSFLIHSMMRLARDVPDVLTNGTLPTRKRRPRP
jgi:hypothetical protein